MLVTAALVPFSTLKRVGWERSVRYSAVHSLLTREKGPFGAVGRRRELRIGQPGVRCGAGTGIVGQGSAGMATASWHEAPGSCPNSSPRGISLVAGAITLDRGRDVEKIAPRGRRHVEAWLNSDPSCRLILRGETHGVFSVMVSYSD